MPVLMLPDGNGNFVPIPTIKGDRGDKGETGPAGPVGPAPTIADATPTTSGLMPAADKSIMNSATNSATANTLAKRDASGRIQVGDAASDGDAMNRKTTTALTSALSTRMNGYDSQLTTIQNTTPSLEELVITTGIQGFRNGDNVVGKLTWNANFSPFTAPFDLKIISCDLLWESWSKPLDTTNYAAVVFRKMSSTGTFTTIADKKTNSEGITQRVPWSMNSASWSTTAAQFKKGESTNFAISFAGTANDMLSPIWITMRYVPM